MSVRPAVSWGVALSPRRQPFHAPVQDQRPSSARSESPSPRMLSITSQASPRFGVRHPGVVSGRARFDVRNLCAALAEQQRSPRSRSSRAPVGDSEAYQACVCLDSRRDPPGALPAEVDPAEAAARQPSHQPRLRYVPDEVVSREVTVPPARPESAPPIGSGAQRLGRPDSAPPIRKLESGHFGLDEEAAVLAVLRTAPLLQREPEWNLRLILRAGSVSDHRRYSHIVREGGHLSNACIIVSGAVQRSCAKEGGTQRLCAGATIGEEVLVNPSLRSDASYLVLDHVTLFLIEAAEITSRRLDATRQPDLSGPRHLARARFCLRFLRQADFFQLLSAAALRHLSQLFEPQVCCRETDLFPMVGPKTFVVVAEGRVELQPDTRGHPPRPQPPQPPQPSQPSQPPQPPQLLTQRDAGSWLNEAALLDLAERPCAAIAAAGTKLLLLRPPSFLSFHMLAPQFRKLALQRLLSPRTFKGTAMKLLAAEAVGGYQFIPRSAGFDPRDHKLTLRSSDYNRPPPRGARTRSGRRSNSTRPKSPVARPAWHDGCEVGDEGLVGMRGREWSPPKARLE